MAEKGIPLPKFGEWDVNDPASADGFTVIFNKARNERKTGGKVESPPKDNPTFKHGAVLGKPQSVSLTFQDLKHIMTRVTGKHDHCLWQLIIANPFFRPLGKYDPWIYHVDNLNLEHKYGPKLASYPQV